MSKPPDGEIGAIEMVGNQNRIRLLQTVWEARDKSYKTEL